MGFLLSHWHCILPVLGIAAAMFLIRDKRKQKDDGHEPAEETMISPKNN